MYRLLIVEDERAIAHGIANSIPWEKWGFCIAGVCSNGEEAVEIIRQDKPDLVLSDIRMPKMDGIALMQYLNENYPEISIIILSGYNDFEYLKMSIRNNVAEYLLKPTDVDEFEIVFKKMKLRLDEEAARKREQDSIRRDRVMNALLKGYGYDEEVMENEFEKLADGRLGVVVFQPEASECQDSRSFYQQQLKIAETLNRRLEDGEEHPVQARFFCNFEEEITAIIYVEEDFEEEELENYIRTLGDAVRQETGAELFAGISNLYPDYRMIPQCYEQSKCCVGQRLYRQDKQGTFFFRQIRDTEFDYYQIAFDEEKIMYSILNCDRAALTEEIEGTFTRLRNQTVKDYDYANWLGLEILLVISRKMLKYQVRPEKIMNEHGCTYSDLSKKQTLEDKQEFLLKIFGLFMEECQIQQAGNTKTRELARKIRTIVDEEYMSNSISLEYIAEKVHKNTAYISKIFKDEFECNFSAYVTGKRLEKSRLLLENAELKIYEISQQLGWADVSNYIKVFKKKYGMSPDEYRKILTKNG